MEHENRSRPPLGQMLVAKGLVREDELVQALAEHERTGRPLGQVLIERGSISAPALADALLLQHSWRPLGQLLVERGLITEAQLEDALEEQERTGRPLGEIVRTRYYVAAATLGDVIAEQHELELELERGFGSGLRRGIERRHQRSRGVATAEPDADASPHESPLGARLGMPAAGATEQMTSLQAALGAREETISALGSANRKRSEEIAGLRSALEERDSLIAELERRLAALEPRSAGVRGLDSR